VTGRPQAPLRLIVLIAPLVLAAPPARGEVKLGNATVEFASADEGRRILTTRDDFVERMSPFDRAARLKTDREVSEQQYLEFVGRSVLAWTDDEQRRIAELIADLDRRLAPSSLPWPEKISLIKTTGAEEGGTAYTRGSSIVLPPSELANGKGPTARVMAHELFHVLSRANPKLRDALYATIGFWPCREIVFPPELAPRKITNPDAPQNRHVIGIRVNGKKHFAAPILISKSEKYDPVRGGEFFAYLDFRLLLVKPGDDPATMVPLDDGAQPRLIKPGDADDFFKQVGMNTHYIIHPEEILADNFALIALGVPKVPSPEILDGMRRVFNKSAP
jgi:hypothetical protein